jgi:hypothetical protein
VTLAIGKAGAGSKKEADSFKALGIAVKNADGSLRSAGEILPDLADRLAAIRDPGKQAAVVYELFGRQGQLLIPLLQQGGEGLREFGRQAEKMGLILDDKVIDQADQASDKLAAVNQQLKANIARTVAENADAITTLADSFIKLTGALVDWWSQNPEQAMALVGAAAGSRFGLPGAAIGGAIGYAAGSNMGAGMADARTELDFRIREMRRAQQALRHAVPDDPGGVVRFRSSGQMTRSQALAELEKQVTLARQAYAAARSAPASRTGAGAGDFDLDLSGGGGSTRTKSRTNREVYDAFQAALRAEGLRPTSGYRTYAEQEALYKRLGPGNAAAPGTSDHEFYKAVDLPANVDREALRRAAARAGVSLKPELVHGKNRHLHQGFEDAGGRGGGGEAELAKAAEEAQRRRLDELRKAHAHAGDLNRLTLDELRLREQAAESIDERARLALEILDAEQKQFDATVDFNVRTEAITAAQGEELKNLNAINHALRQRAIEADRSARLEAEAQSQLRELYGARLSQLDHELTLLDLSSDLARTAGERREIEFRILDAVMQRERLEIEAIKATNAINSAAWQEADLREKRLDAMRARSERDIRGSTAGPMEDYLSRLPRTAAEVNEALEAVRVNGIQSIIDGLADAATGARSLGDVFKNVANQIISDLIRIQLQKAIAGAIGNALGLHTGINPSLSTVGVPPGFGGGSANWGTPGLGLPGRAYGGNLDAGQAAWVGENGPEIIRPRVPSVVIPNHSAGGPGGGRPYFDLRGAVLTSDLLAQMNKIGRVALSGGAQLGAAGGEARVMKRAARHFP